MQNASSGHFKDGRLTLHDAGPAIFFSDRPYRVFGHVTPQRLVESWNVGKDNFASDPPNATLSILGDEVQSAVIELSDPKYDGKAFSYKVNVLSGSVPDKFGHASLFIDNDLWAAVGGLAVGRMSARAQDARTVAAYSAGQQSMQKPQATTYQGSQVAYTAQPAAPCAPSGRRRGATRNRSPARPRQASNAEQRQRGAVCPRHFNVDNGRKTNPGAELSRQTSTAGREAPGTRNVEREAHDQWRNHDRHALRGQRRDP